MNSYWANQRASQNYKRELQKRLSSSYNHRLFDVDSSNSNPESNNIDYVSNTISPIIQIHSVSFNYDEDGSTHHTSDYDLMQDEKPFPVFRRGQQFSITLHFNRNYNAKEDFFHLLAEYGPTPSLKNGTKYKISLSDKNNEDKYCWEIRAKEVGDSEIKIQVQTPSNCQVGLWTFSIFTYKADTAGNSRFNFPQDIYILFNPWNESDEVYLANEQERQEYVLSDHGQIWMGTNKAPVAYPWVFGQFDLVVLPVMAILMEQSDVPHAERGSAVLISRAISAVINSYDDDGLLVGKWKGEFDDGTKPFAWSGSVGIFQEYLQNGRSVKYAQCWVFCGAITTACRALGIPCRPVTCYVCAHDTNNSLTVDKFFSRDGQLIEGGADGDCFDSTWNFHCWNDVWMSRLDLPPGYDGWQTIDGTPQEESNRKYRTGPSPLKAIKEGNIGFQYDTGFIFSEVNADLCHFQEDSHSPWGFTRIKLDPAHTGRRIVTQSLVNDKYGERGMEDITSLYKHTEGSEAEREAVFNALKGHPKAQKYYQAVSQQIVRDVFFKLKDIQVIFVGDSFSVDLNIENHASVPRTIKATLSASSIIYTGQSMETIKQATVEVTLRAKESKMVKITVTPEEYKSKLGNNWQVKVMVVARVLETKQTFTAEDDFEIIKKRLEIKVPEQIKVGSISQVHFFFTNPFIEQLTNCELTIEGPGLQRPKTVKLSNVAPHGQIKYSESLVPRRPGARALVATFNSDQLPSIKGFKQVQVGP